MLQLELDPIVTVVVVVVKYSVILLSHFPPKRYENKKSRNRVKKKCVITYIL